MYESEQWTYTDRGHTPLTVDTQELASRENALTACYLSSVCESEQWTYTDREHTPLTVDTQKYTRMGQHTPLTVDTQKYTRMGQQREGID